MRTPKITVVIPGYNHENYIGPAIRSVLAQDWPELELHVMDDGSDDDTFAAAERAVEDPAAVRCRIERQENQGSSRTLNRLIERTDTDYVAILNSDDQYATGRLRRFAQRAESEELFFGVSAIEFHEDGECADLAQFEKWYSSKLQMFSRLPTCGFAQLTGNLSVTSSNFFFSREVFDLTGGFEPELSFSQDWDFSIKALRWVEPVFLPEKLMTYRIHPDNTWRRLVDVRREQCELVLQDYATWAMQYCPNPLAPVSQNWPKFFPFFSRVCGTWFSADPIGNSLPKGLVESDTVGGTASAGDQAALARLLAPASQVGATDIALDTIAAHWQAVRQVEMDSHAQTAAPRQRASN
ncbi:MAG: glycosyltransferase family A protein [Pseudomonadota bacterium]